MESQKDEIVAVGSEPPALQGPAAVVDAKSVNVVLADNDLILKTVLESLSLWHYKKSFVYLVIMLVVVVFQAAIFYAYTYIPGVGFTEMGRQYAWCFLCLSIMYLARVLHFVCYWKKVATRSAKKALVNSGRRGNKVGDPRRRWKGLCCAKIYHFYFKNFGINGTLYFYKLSSYELVENYTQYANMIQVYGCTLPLLWNFGLSVVLILEAAHRTFFWYTKIRLESGKYPVVTISDRNFLVLVDAMVDLVFMFIPLFGMYTIYKIPISAYETLRIILVPSFSLWGKLGSLFKESLYARVHETIVMQQEKAAKSLRRHRKSIYRKSYTEIIIEDQNNFFPLKVKRILVLHSVSYCLLVLVTLIIWPVTTLYSLRKCSKLLGRDVWEEGCVNKIPFCNNLFQPKCNCAYLHLENKYNLTHFPENIVYEMDALRKLFVQNSALKHLPSNMEKMAEIVDFEISATDLSAFNLDTSKLGNLVRLILPYNKIQSLLYQKELWNHPKLNSLDLASNPGLKFPNQNDFKVLMPSLQYLGFANNSAQITMPVTAASFPGLLYLFLDGNPLKRFPSPDLALRLQFLGLGRCNMTALPTYLSDFTKLRYLDARYNNISKVDQGLIELIEANGVEAYFAGNHQLCQGDNVHKIINCKPLCSPYCWSDKAHDNGVCDVTCNSPQCSFDNNDCASNGADVSGK